jgi:hypothetical protein
MAAVCGRAKLARRLLFSDGAEDAVMFASARLRMMALAVAVTSALTAAPATAQGQPHEDVGLPLTPPPLKTSNPRYEETPTVRPSGSVGFALFVVLFGPVGLALGGSIAAAATPGPVALPFTPTPTIQPLAPAVEPRRAGASE